MAYMCCNYVSDHSTDKAIKLRMTKSYPSEEVYLFAVRKSQGFFFQPWTAVLIKQADLGDVSSVY